MKTPKMIIKTIVFLMIGISALTQISILIAGYIHVYKEYGSLSLIVVLSLWIVSLISLTFLRINRNE